MSALIFIIAGEPSGDQLGARLMVALKRESADLRFAGLGGPLMQAEGLQSLFDIGELALFGFVEVLRHVPRIKRRIEETLAEVTRLQPDLVLTIDSPGFCLRVAKRLKGKGIPLVHYVAPQVWAWKPGRAKKIAAYLDHLLCLLPFEPPLFEVHGLPSTFVGHSAIEAAAITTDPIAFRQRHKLGAETPLLCALPGSRRSEVSRLMPVMAETLKLLAPQLPGLTVLLPTVNTVADHVRQIVQTWPVPALVLTGQQEKYEAFAASRVAMAASGTVGLELAIAGMPAVILYKINPLSAALAKRFILVKWASLPSLVLNRLVQPEYLQHFCTPPAVAAGLMQLWQDGEPRRQVIDSGLEAARLLGKGDAVPSTRAARAVLSLLGTGERPGKGP